MTGNRAHKWPGRSFAPAVPQGRGGLTARPRRHHRGDAVLAAGMISLRIRAGEDRQRSPSSAAPPSRCLSAATRSRARTSNEGPKSAEEDRLRARETAPMHTSVVNAEFLESMLELTAKTAALASERGERRLRLPGAAIDQDFAAPCSPKPGRERGRSGKYLQTPT